jgi:hypothetical protein
MSHTMMTRSQTRIAELEAGIAATIDTIKDRCLPLPISVNGKFCISKDYPVEVKSAGDKGMGVFATKNIKQGDICCYYDGIICDGSKSALLITGEYGFSQALPRSSRVLAGFRSQIRHGGCAQMCNDASTTYTDNKDLTYLKNINVEEYSGYDDSGQPFFCFVATKRIKKGEELLYSYGNGYWKAKFERKASKAKENHCVKSFFESYSNDEIAKLNKLIAESTSKMENENLKFEKYMIEGFKKLYDTKGESLKDYLNRHIITQMLARY